MTDWFDLPFTSIGLFILVGLLLGYLLWYRDRSADQAKIDMLENRYLQARSVARKRKAQQQAAIKQSQSMQAQAARSQSKAAEFEQDKLIMHRQFAEERRRSESIKSQMQEVLQSRSQQKMQLDAAKHAYDRLNEKYGALQQKYESMQEAMSANPPLSAETIAAFEETIERLHAEVDYVTRENVQKSEQLGRTQQDLVQRCQDLDDLRRDRDTIAEELQHTVDRAVALEGELAETMEESRQLLHQQESRINQNHAQHRELEQIVSERDSTIGELTEQYQRSQAELQRLCKLVDDLLPHRHQVKALQSDIQQFRDELQSEARSREQVQAELDRAEEQLAAASGDVDQRQAAIKLLQAQVQRIRPLEEKLAQYTRQNADQQSALAKQRDRISSLQDHIESQQHQIRGMHQELELFTATQQELKEVQSQLDTLTDHCESLMTGKRNLELTVGSLQDQAVAQSERIAQLRQRLTQVDTERESSVQASELASQRILDLEKELQISAARIRQLQRTRSTTDDNDRRAA